MISESYTVFHYLISKYSLFRLKCLDLRQGATILEGVSSALPLLLLKTKHGILLEGGSQ